MQLTADFIFAQLEIDELTLEDLELGALASGDGRDLAPVIWTSLLSKLQKGAMDRQVWVSNVWLCASVGFETHRRKGGFAARGLSRVAEALALLEREGKITIKDDCVPDRVRDDPDAKPMRVIEINLRSDRRNPRVPIKLPGGDPVRRGGRWCPNTTTSAMWQLLRHVEPGAKGSYRRPTATIATAWALHLCEDRRASRPMIKQLASMTSKDPRWVGARLDRLAAVGIINSRQDRSISLFEPVRAEKAVCADQAPPGNMHTPDLRIRPLAQLRARGLSSRPRCDQRPPRIVDIPPSEIPF